MRYHQSLTALLGGSVLLIMVGGAVGQPGVVPTPIAGQFAIETLVQRTLLTARDGGHHTYDAIITDAPAIGPNARPIGPNERFRLAFSNYPTPQYMTIQTANGFFVQLNTTAGDLPDPQRAILALNTEGLSPLNDAFYWRLNYVPGQFPLHTIQTITGNYLTALGGGGKSTAAFHTDARNASTWEFFKVRKCGDLGTNLEYMIRLTSGAVLIAPGGGGRVKYAIALSQGAPDDFTTSRFRLIQQPDGSHALQTSNGRNFVTAIRGGGLAHGTSDWDNLVTDRTQAQSWETFRIVDRGDCTYTIQTVSGFLVGWSPTRGFSTDLSDPDAARQIGFEATFELNPLFSG